jgi:hypothetical protein
MAQYSDDMIARILVEAAYNGDEPTCHKYGISDRTLRRWKASLSENVQLSENVRLKKAEMDRNWADDAPLTIKAGMEFIAKAAQEGNAKNPDMVHAVAGGIKIVSEIMAVREYLDAKLNHTET